jgi:hypothetical protein
MSSNLLRKYIDIINDSTVEEKSINPYAIGMAAAKKKYGYGDEPVQDLPKKVIKKAHDIGKSIDKAR